MTGVQALSGGSASLQALFAAWHRRPGCLLASVCQISPGLVNRMASRVCSVFLFLVLAHPGCYGQRAIKWLLLLLLP